MPVYRVFGRVAVAASAILVALSIGWPVYSGDAATDSQQRLLTDIKYLSSDDLEGRGVGLKGLDLAADYIRDQFAKAGLKLDAVGGQPYQRFSMNVGAEMGPTNSLTLVAPSQNLLPVLNTDFVPQSFGGAGAFSGDVVFCGYGIVAEDKNYDDFASVDVKGKVVIIMRRTPQQGLVQGAFAAGRRGMSPHAELRTKVRIAAEKGAAAILFVNDPFSGRDELDKGKKQVAKLADAVVEAAVAFEAADPNDAEKTSAARKQLSAEVAKLKSGKAHLGDTEPDELMKFGYAGSEPMRSLPILHVTRALVDQMLKPALGKTLADLEAAIDKDLKPQSAVLSGWIARGEVTIERKQAEVKNVIAVLEGTGPLADETVVIGAHYDHVGRGGNGSLLPGSTEIHNGADDNASGTVALLELARRLAARPEKLPRRLVFMAFTGEELGLVGSARYTREPVFPLEKTIAMLNMDMVGRLEGDKLTVFGTGTSPIWEKMLNALGKEYHMQMTFRPEGLGPSDHSSFYSKQIPVLHFFTGNHRDYHRPSDDWEKINIPGEERIVSLIEKIVLDVATDPERPRYVEVRGRSNIDRPDRGTGEGRPYFGSIPDFGGDKPGYLLSGVSPNSPAEKAGLKAGDLIVQVGKSTIQNLEDFDLALRQFSAGDTVDVTVRRGEQNVTLKVTLERPRGG